MVAAVESKEAAKTAVDKNGTPVPSQTIIKEGDIR